MFRISVRRNKLGKAHRKLWAQAYTSYVKVTVEEQHSITPFIVIREGPIAFLGYIVTKKF
jgi:hypothetical protein